MQQEHQPVVSLQEIQASASFRMAGQPPRGEQEQQGSGIVTSFSQTSMGKGEGRKVTPFSETSMGKGEPVKVTPFRQTIYG